MSQKLSVILAIAAGFLGGFVSREFSLPSVHAQAQAPVEIRAQRFTLVDDQGRPIGTFAARQRTVAGSNDVNRQILFLDPAGHVIWSAGGDPFKALTQNSK